MKYEILILNGRYRFGYKGRVSYRPCSPLEQFETELECARRARELAGPSAAMQGMSSSVGEHWLGIWKSPRDCRSIKAGGRGLPAPFAVRSSSPFDQKIWESV